MPTYEYQCTKCEQEFEYFQSIKEEPKTVCEKCGGNLVKLLSGGTGLIFKGSGFYITDYKSSGAPAESSPAKADTSAKSDSPAKADSTPSKSE